MATSYDDLMGYPTDAIAAQDPNVQNYLQVAGGNFDGTPAAQPAYDPTQGGMQLAQPQANIPAQPPVAPIDYSGQVPGVTQSPQADPSMVNAMQAANAQAPNVAPPVAPAAQVQAPPAVAPQRKRVSFMDILGHLSDAANIAGGQHTFAQRQQDYAAQQQAAALDNQAKQADITQTGVATQAAQNQILGGYARGLQAIKANGGDPAVAATALAQRMGIPVEQAQAIAQGIQSDPNYLDGLVDALNAPDKTGKAGRSLGLNLVPAIGPDGKPVFLQAGEDGTAHPLAGYAPPAKLMAVNTGDGTDLVDAHTAAPVHRYVKNGAPDAGAQAVTDAKGNVIGYTPVPGSKLQITNQALVAKNQAATQAKAEQYTDARSSLATLNDQINGILSDPHLASNLGVMGSVQRRIPGTPAQGVQAKIDTAAGQMVGTAIARLRAVSPNGSLGFRPSEKEILALQNAIAPIKQTDQNAGDYVRNARAGQKVIQGWISRLDAAHTAAPAASAPTKTAPQPTGGWGKAQVVQ